MSNTLVAETRSDESGKGVARKLRALGKVPAVVYNDGNPARHITINADELTAMFRHTKNRNTVVDVTVDGQATPCLVRDAQRHPVTREILHVDFFALREDKVLRVMVPVSTSGKSQAANIGGRIRIIRRELPVTCTYKNIPETLDIDVTPLNIGDMVKSSQMVTPEGVEIALVAPINVISCYGRKVVAKKVVAKETKKKK